MGDTPQRPKKRPAKGGRATEKKSAKDKDKATEPTPTGRYTPRQPAIKVRSPIWIPVLMFGFLALGVLILIGNYLPGIPPESESNWFLLWGLGFITVGFLFGTRFH